MLFGSPYVLKHLQTAGRYVFCIGFFRKRISCLMVDQGRPAGAPFERLRTSQRPRDSFCALGAEKNITGGEKCRSGVVLGENTADCRPSKLILKRVGLRF